MKWIKASERLPKKLGRYWIHYINQKGIEKKTGSLFDGHFFPHHKGEIFWLDESPPAILPENWQTWIENESHQLYPETYYKDNPKDLNEDRRELWVEGATAMLPFIDEKDDKEQWLRENLYQSYLRIKKLEAALRDIKNWNDTLEDRWGDPGERATHALKSKHELIEINEIKSLRQQLEEKEKELERLKAEVKERDERENNPYWYWPQCDVDGCEGVSCNGGGCWRETGYWSVCSKHSDMWRRGAPQPQMKQSAIDKEATRDPITGCLPFKSQQP